MPRLLTHNGETHSIAEWARIIGIRLDTLLVRLDRQKWPVDRALTPIDGRIKPAWNFINIAGQRFGYLTVVELVASADAGQARWRCRCNCGRATVVQSQSLRNGTTKSCGCLKQQKTIDRSTKHGDSKRIDRTKEYLAWKGAKSRCFNPKAPQFQHYGGRGITMCAEWVNDFPAFLKHMGRCPPGMELDRYPNNDGNYEPGNCRWATKKQQARNQRKTQLLTYNGKTKPQVEWAEQFSIDVKTLRYRLNHNWPIDKALMTPVH